MLLLLLVGTTQINAQHSTYYIGHSGFGWDLVVGEMVDDLAADAGITTYDYDFQFIGGTCISNQWQSHANPQGGTDSWVELPTGNYDVVVIAEQIPIQEVIYGSPWCAPIDYTSVEALDLFYDMAVNANPNTRIYLMELHNEIDQTANTPHADWVNLNAAMRPLWEQVADSVSLLNNGPDVCIVPVSEAFEALADSVMNGVYPGTSNWIDLFAPDDTVVATIHPTEETFYLAACVHYAVIFGQSPVGLTNVTTAEAGWPFDPPTPAQALMMQEIAWEIVSNDPYSCIGPDGLEDAQDKEDGITIQYHAAYDLLKIESKNQPLEHATLCVYNSMGQLVFEQGNLSGHGVEVKLSSLQSGVYIYTLSEGDQLLITGKLLESN